MAKLSAAMVLALFAGTAIEFVLKPGDSANSALLPTLWGPPTLALVFAAVLAVTRRHTQKLGELEAALHRLAQGDADVSVRADGAGETAALSLALQTLREAILRHRAGEEALHADLARSAAMLRQLPVAALAERGGLVTQCNPAFERLFGYGAAELNGAPWRKLFAEDAAFTCVRTGLLQFRQSDAAYESEAQMRRQDGSVFWCRLQAAAADSETHIWVCSDIAAAKRAEADSQAALRRLEDMLAERTRQLDAACREPFPPFPAPRQPLSAQSIELADAIDGVTASLMPMAQVKGLELVVDVDGSLPCRLIADPLVLSQVLTELIANAIRQTAHGEVVLVVRQVGGVDGKARLLFSIRDQGRTPLRARQEGAEPAGLAIARRLVERLGGTLGIGSAYGQGCIYHFVADFVRASGEGQADRYLEVLRPLAGARVMVVDDNRTARLVAGARLAELGFVPDLFESGWAALASLVQAKAPKYAAICIDSRMPDIDGLELARRVRGHYGAKCPPLLLLTALSPTREAKAAVHGFAAVVSKPLVIARLQAQLTAVLGAPAAQPAPAPSLLGGKRVLLVDAALRLAALVDLLLAQGIKAAFAGDGFEAMQAVREREPDCVLLDCRPSLDEAIETARALRAMASPALVIVGLAEGADEAARAAAMAAGMSEVLAGPPDLPATLALIARWLAPSPNVLPLLPPELDVASGLRHLRGKTELFLKALRMFRDGCGQRFQQEFRAATGAGDWQMAAKLAYNLKTTATTLGAWQVATAAGRLESVIRGGGHAEVDPLLADVTEKLRVLVEGLARIG